MNTKRADAVCALLKDGKSLRAACRMVEGAIPMSILDWAKADPEGFGLQYASARLAGYTLLADEILDISDDGENDTYPAEDGAVTNHDVIARSRLRVDSRKWMLAKMLPKVYGDKIAVGGADDLPPISQSLTVQFVGQV